MCVWAVLSFGGPVALRPMDTDEFPELPIFAKSVCGDGPRGVVGNVNGPAVGAHTDVAGGVTMTGPRDWVIEPLVESKRSATSPPPGRPSNQSTSLTA